MKFPDNDIRDKPFKGQGFEEKGFGTAQREGFQF